MIERRLFRIVKAGIDWYAERPERFQRFLLTQKELSEEEAAIARIYFGGDPDASPPVEPHPPTLIHGYARTGGPFPCVALTLGGEDISTDYLGRDASMLGSDGEEFFDPETGAVVDPHVRRMRYTFNFLIHADHPDVAIWYYHLLKQIIISSHRELEADDVEDVTISGRDLAPDARYLPDTIFTRMLVVTCEGDEVWDSPMGDRASSVAGIHVENRTTGVTGGVTPYVEE